MTDDVSGSPETDGSTTIQMAWRPTASFFVDAVVGIANAGGASRVTLGQVTFNPIPSANAPLLTPVCTLVMTLDGLDNLIAALQDARTGLAGDDD